METIASFCDRHEACEDGKQWALESCSTMLDVWERAQPKWLVWVATRPGVVDDKTLRLFACWCARQVWHLLEDKRSRNAVLTAEKFAYGTATEDELSAACAAARTANRAVTDAKHSVRRALWVAIWAAWSDPALAAGKAADGSAWAATRDVRADDAWKAAREGQAKWLRENAKPNFEVVLKKSEDAK